MSKIPTLFIRLNTCAGRWRGFSSTTWLENAHLVVLLPHGPQDKVSSEGCSTLVRRLKIRPWWEIGLTLWFGDNWFGIAWELHPRCSGLELFCYPAYLELFMYLLEAFNGNLDLVLQKQAAPAGHGPRNCTVAIALLSFMLGFICL